MATASEDTEMTFSAPGVSNEPPKQPAPPRILERETQILLGAFKSATVTVGQIIHFASIINKQKPLASQTSLPGNLVAKLGAELEQYDHACDVMQETILQSMAVIRRDIEREKARLALQETQSKPSQDDVIIISDDESESKMKATSKGKERLKTDIGTVDEDGVIHIDSDSDSDDSDIVEIMGPPGGRKSKSAPQGISLSALQASPSGGTVIDLQSMSEGQPLSPSGGLSSPKKRGSTLHLDLSSEALRGITGLDDDGPSPVTLAPRTGRLLSAHPSSMVTSGPGGPMNPFFMDLAAAQAASAVASRGGVIDQSLIHQDLLSAITTQSQAQHDLIGSLPGTGAGQHLMDLPTMADATSLAMDAASLSHQMDLDLFGEVVDDDDNDEALVNSQLQGDFSLDETKLEGERGDVVGSQELERLLSEHGVSVGGDPVAPNDTTVLGLLMSAQANQASTLSGAANSSVVDVHAASNDAANTASSEQPTTTPHADQSAATAGTGESPKDAASSQAQPAASINTGAMVVGQPGDPAQETSTTAPSNTDASTRVQANTAAPATEPAKSNPASVGGFTPFGDLGDMGLDMNMNIDDIGGMGMGMGMGMGSIDFSSLLGGNPSGASGSGNLDLGGLGMDLGGELGGLGGDGFDLNLGDMDFGSMGMFGGLGGQGGPSGTGSGSGS